MKLAAELIDSGRLGCAKSRALAALEAVKAASKECSATLEG